MRLSPLFKPAGSFAFAVRGKVLAARFNPMLLGTVDGASEASLAAQRCSKRL
jgi:hypothetical protein